MKNFATLITACIVAGWIAAIALIAIQNATPITLQFLTVQSIEIPFGLVLAFSVVLGILGTAIAQPIFGVSSSSTDDD